MFVPIYYLLNTNTPISLMHCCIHNFFLFVISQEKLFLDGIYSTRLQRHNLHVHLSWICDYVLIVSSKVTPRHVRQTLAKTNEAAVVTWEIGIFPSILQRQRDVKGWWPFPANQREGLLPLPLLWQWRGFHVCVGSWTPGGTCILSGISWWYRYLSSVFAWKRGSQSFIN